MDEIRPGYVAIGRVLAATGLRGELKTEPLGPESALAAGRNVTIAGRHYRIERCLRSRRFLRLKLAGVDTREEAQALSGAYVQVLERDLNPLPEGEYYRFQLLGLAVRSLQGDELGRIVDVFSAPANDIYVVKGPYGELLIPAVDDVIRDIDITNGIITIQVIPGLVP